MARKHKPDTIHWHAPKDGQWERTACGRQYGVKALAVTKAEITCGTCKRSSRKLSCKFCGDLPRQGEGGWHQQKPICGPCWDERLRVTA